MREKTQDQLDLQACHRVRSRLVARRTATINQIRAFLIEKGITVRAGATALRQSLFPMLKNRADEFSPRMSDLLVGLYSTLSLTFAVRCSSNRDSRSAS